MVSVLILGRHPAIRPMRLHFRTARLPATTFILLWFNCSVLSACERPADKSEQPLVPRIRLEPLSPDSWTSPSPNPRRNVPSFPRHIVFDGVLSTTLPSLLHDATGSHAVGAMFLAQGEFAFRAVVDDLQSQDPDSTSMGERVGKVYFSPLLHVHVK